MKHIVEIDPRIKVKLDDLFVPPVVIRVNKFNEDSAKEFAEKMSDAHNTGQDIIPIVIDSYGGQVYSLLAMMAEIENSNLPVATIGMGKSMSCGSVLMTCGDEGYRFMDKNATIMIHDVSSWSYGKVEEIKSDAKETERLNQLIFRKMANNCGHRDEEYFIKKIHEKGHAEWYLTADQAKKAKIINHIRVPSIKTTVSIDTEFK
jgi:ATP-dependent Clp endopeptidase proteolytic subunit ClpP